MKIAITGSSGLVGSALVASLELGGQEVLRLVRRAPRPEGGEARWAPARGELDPGELEGCDAVVHLSGENIAQGRWSPARKERIRSSRVDSTRLLAETLARLERPPRVLVAASAIGCYGDRGDESLSEESAPGTGFLAEVCREWEGASEAAARAGIRVARARLGVVFTPAGGALAKMLPAFRLGAGGRVGSGRQYVSWIALDDVIAGLSRAIEDDSLSGPVNLTAPEPVTNRELARVLGRVLHRPAFLPLPAFAARAMFGEMADHLLLASTRVHPRRLLEVGFEFSWPRLEPALRHLLDRRREGD